MKSDLSNGLMNNPLRIYVIGKDAWALGTEYRLAKACLSTFATIVDTPSDADFIHTVDVEDTSARIYRGEFIPTKPIVGAVNNHPTRLVEWPGFVHTASRYMYLVPQSTLAATDMQRLALNFPCRARIATDAESYFAIESDNLELIRFRQRIGLCDDAYIIGLFQRDSEGRDLTVPKRQKGPDIFLSLMLLLQKQLADGKFHVLLGGPRRHWIRNAFEQHDIPYTFVGQEIKGDDYPDNILDKQTMCLLYNLLDLYVIPTRWEGAPRQVFDVLECGRKIISTPVGIAPDILPPGCVFDSLKQGVDIIRRDMESGYLEQFIQPAKETVQTFHSIQSAGQEWEKVYKKISQQEGACGGMSFKSLKKTSFGVNTLSPFCFKPVSFLLEKTRLGQMKKYRFPKKIGVIGIQAQIGLFSRLSDKLGKLGVKVKFNSNVETLIVLWNIHLDNFKCLSSYAGKRIILVLDEMCCTQLLQYDQNGNKRLAVLEIAEMTIVTSDVDLARLRQADIKISNPMVVRFPPIPSLVRSIPTKTRCSSHEVKCLVFVDHDAKWSFEWLQALKQQAGIYCTVINNISSGWLQKTEQDRVAVARENDFMVILSSQVDRVTVGELLACGLPCLYAEILHGVKSLVGMAGLGVDSLESFVDGVGTLRDHYEIFSHAISLPSLDESAMVLADIVYNTFCLNKVSKIQRQKCDVQRIKKKLTET